ncbi:MAG: VWA domain-containing protein, partial [Alphaproteobacteria bacterium]|nr:VWA domain-containing protein [Alphaproteobacteria bacterium]
MFLFFFLALRDEGVPVSLREYLAFLEGLQAGLVTCQPEGFYVLGRVAMVKDERHLDRYDRAFAKSFKGLEAISDAEVLEAIDLPADWLAKLAEKHLTPEERAQIEALGGFDKLMETLNQ